jgi:ATP-binding cassette subfamily B protein
MGCLQALRALSFQIVARRIGIWVRTRLFNTMMRQDIAFFDGMRTGDLQNRLSEDISTMVQPIYTTLSTVLSNLMILVGGVTMCFLTSWRLSMLAFTTILPMMHITGVYAEWSRGINKQIYQQYASPSHPHSHSHACPMPHAAVADAQLPAPHADRDLGSTLACAKPLRRHVPRGRGDQ